MTLRDITSETLNLIQRRINSLQNRLDMYCDTKDLDTADAHILKTLPVKEELTFLEELVSTLKGNEK